MIILICKHCGKETSYVICEHCGMNVVWYNKYGVQHDVPTDDLSNISFSLSDEDKNESIETVIDDIFVPDGSGD